MQLLVARSVQFAYHVTCEFCKDGSDKWLQFLFCMMLIPVHQQQSMPVYYGLVTNAVHHTLQV